MKRLVVGIVTLAAVLGGVWWSLADRTARVEHMLTAVDAIEAAYADGRQKECLRLCEQFYETAKEQADHFFPFTTHEELHTLQETAACLSVLLRQGDDGCFAEELARCRQQLLALKEEDLPTFGNIF